MPRYQGNGGRKADGKERMQKGKNGKRGKHWHRGSVESMKWDNVVDHLESVFAEAKRREQNG